MELSSLARLTHSRHFDTVKHGVDGLVVPAGLILALATSLSARDLHEVCTAVGIERGEARADRELWTATRTWWHFHRSEAVRCLVQCDWCFALLGKDVLTYTNLLLLGDRLCRVVHNVHAIHENWILARPGQTLHEELLYANFINPLQPGDSMTSITFIQQVEQHPNGETCVVRLQ